MTCADTSSMIAYAEGQGGRDVDAVEQALADRSLVLAPVSVTELLSDPESKPDFERFVLGIIQLEIIRGYWVRAGELRRALVLHGYHPKVADTLIAQSCLDHDVALITRDKDFAPFQKLAGLRLL